MRWTTAQAYAHQKLGIEGKAGLSPEWRVKHGDPPKHILVRPAGGAGKPVVLGTFMRPGDDEDFALTQKQLVDVAGANLTPLGATVEYRKAGRIARYWYTPDAVLATVVAITGWLAAAATGIFVYLRLASDAAQSEQGGSGKTADWLVAFAAAVAVVTAVAATLKLIKDLRDARK